MIGAVLLAALFERAAQDGKHGAILVTTGFELGANQRLQSQDVDAELAELPPGTVGDQLGIAVAMTDAPEDIKWSAARDQQTVSFPFEARASGRRTRPVRSR